MADVIVNAVTAVSAVAAVTRDVVVDN